MQNLPDKGLSRFHHYLQADTTGTGLTGMAHGSQGKRRGKSKAISILGHGMAETLAIAMEA